MRVVLLGTGTSFGIPMIGCKCPVCTSSDVHNQRLRSSAYIEKGEARLLLDCTPDFRAQALQYGIDHIDAVFFTHAHFDHIAGIDDLRIFTLRSNHPIDVFGNDICVEDIKQRYGYFFNPPQIGGGILSLNLHVIDTESHYNGVTVTPIPVKHGILDILGYRFDDFGYITDASYVSTESIDLLKGIRILIINALRQRPHETHFSIGQAIEVADAIAPEQTYFTHICHHLEHSETNSTLPSHYQLAYDGLEIVL